MHAPEHASSAQLMLGVLWPSTSAPQSCSAASASGWAQKVHLGLLLRALFKGLVNQREPALVECRGDLESRTL